MLLHRLAIPRACFILAGILVFLALCLMSNASALASVNQQTYSDGAIFEKVTAISRNNGHPFIATFGGGLFEPLRAAKSGQRVQLLPMVHNEYILVANARVGTKQAPALSSLGGSGGFIEAAKIDANDGSCIFVLLENAKSNIGDAGKFVVSGDALFLHYQSFGQRYRVKIHTNGIAYWLGERELM